MRRLDERRNRARIGRAAGHEHPHDFETFAARVVRFSPAPGYLRARRDGNPDASHLNVQVIQRESLPRVDLEDIIEASTDDGRQPGLREYKDVYQQEPVVTVEIDGDISPDTAARIEQRIWDHMPSHRHLRPDEIGTYLDGVKPRHSDPLALAQLLIAYRIVAARDEMGNEAGGAPALARMP